MSLSIGEVSIIVPCYNGKNFIKQCFESILEQTYTNIQVLFIDDGSSDGSYQEAKKYENKFADKNMTLKCFKKENGGAASAVQLALENLNSEFFELLDIDDLIYPDNIKLKVEYLKKHKECNFCRNDGDIFNLEQAKVVSAFANNAYERKTYKIFEDLLFGKTYNWTGTYLIRSLAFFKANNGKKIYISRYGQNMQILLPLAYYGECGFVNKKLSRYIEYPVSVSHASEYEKNIMLLNGYEDIRINILKQMQVLNKKLLKQIKKFYALERMKMASRFSKKADVFKNFRYVEKTPKNIVLFFTCFSAAFLKLYINIAKAIKNEK